MRDEGGGEMKGGCGVRDESRVKTEHLENRGRMNEEEVRSSSLRGDSLEGGTGGGRWCGGSDLEKPSFTFI